MSTVKTDSIGEHTAGAGTTFLQKLWALASAAITGTLSVSGLITASSGITFGAQTLSHYEEGTWTPVMSGATTPGVQTYAAAIGAYVRVGRFVTVNCKIVLSAKDAAMAGDVIITGLPFAANAALGDAVVTAGYISLVTLTTGYTQLCGLIPSNQSKILLRQTGSNAGPLPIDATSISGTMQITMSASYNI